MEKSINAETVSELLAAVRGLVRDEQDRETSFNTRASGLTGFVGIILSLGAAAGASTGKDAGSVSTTVYACSPEYS